MRLRKPQPEVAESTSAAAQLLEALLHGNRRALTYVDSLGVIEHLGFVEIAREAAQWSELLREHGVEPGDHVIVLAGRDRVWRCALLGVLQAGGVAVPCPAATPVAELREIAAHAGAGLFVSARARPDLVGLNGTPVLSADELDRHDSAGAAAQLPHNAILGDVALSLYARHAAGLHGTMHTYASLLAQAEAGGHWLGVRADERVWCTAAEGSVESLWLMLAAWRQGAEIVVVDQALDPKGQLELLGGFHPAAVWFSDDEYAVLASTAAPRWVELGSVRRALTSDVRANGATAFQNAFGAKVAPVYGCKESGVFAGCPSGTCLPLPGIQLAIVDEQGNELPSGQVGDVVVRGDAPSLFAGYAGARGGAPKPDEWFRVGARGRLNADEGSLRLEQIDGGAGVSVAGAVDEDRPATVDLPRPDLLPTIDEREAARAEERRRTDEERRRAEEERRRSEDEKRREEERLREAKRARRRQEQEANERQKVEERRRREEAKSRELAERAAAKERRLVEKAERAAADAEARRRAEDEKRREEERRRGAAEQAERERLTAEATAREAKEKRKRDEERRREEERRTEAAERAERERLAPDVLSRISQYGMTTRPVDPDTRRDAEVTRERAGAAERNERRDTE